MKNVLITIENKIKEKFKPQDIKLIDQSYLHKKHKSFDKKKIHLKLIIKCPELKKLNTIEANRKIFSVLREELNNNIHSLQLEIN